MVAVAAVVVAAAAAAERFRFPKDDEQLESYQLNLVDYLQTNDHMNHLVLANASSWNSCSFVAAVVVVTKALKEIEEHSKKNTIGFSSLFCLI